MSDFNKKIPLYGGRSTPDVYKVGDLVIRPHKQNSDFVNDILKFLEINGYEHSHRFVCLDKEGNDVYKYEHGEVPKEIGSTTIDQLCKFITMIRKLHDLTENQFANHKVICHNDLSPCNVVFINNQPHCIIDWDSVALGERWEDVTYVLWLWINIGSHHRDQINILSQMKQALLAYGIDKLRCDDFAQKLIWRMNKVKSDMQLDNFQYERTCQWVEYSKLWVYANEDEINKLLKE